MLYEGTSLAKAIEAHRLPDKLEDLFGDLYDPTTSRFLLQETTLIDFKETIPRSFGSGYGAGIARLAIALYNTYGGVIVFGVEDQTFRITSQPDLLNVESLNRLLSDKTDHQIECLLGRYAISAQNESATIQVLLVPRRSAPAPARLIEQLDKYDVGTIWVRDRHEVVEARFRHLPLMYSDRGTYSESDVSLASPPHRSLPSPPATMEEFIGRWALMVRLWDWLTVGSQPRQYVCGPGGSGKSTLAYAFAKQLAESPQAVVPNHGSQIDYVVYLTAKESSFNPTNRHTEEAINMDFSDTESLFKSILFHSGVSTKSELDGLNIASLEKLLDDLFDNFAGLIVIDDIDALSRRGVDTGEETLLLKSVRSGSRTKILYTSRYAPAYALTSAIEVPGLDFSLEFMPFLESCCAQFSVPLPLPDIAPRIAECTDRLPLLVETIVGLRRSCSSYKEAIEAYEAREGDAARRYLYQREYDRLDPKGKSRHVLCVLSLIDSPISSSAIAHLSSASSAQVLDAIAETRGIFLTAVNTENGDTHYIASQPAARYLKQTSSSLAVFPALKQAVDHFSDPGVGIPAHEAAVLAGLTKLARSQKLSQIVEECNSIPRSESVWGNPNFLGLLGQGYASQGLARSEDARECFKTAFALHCRDIFMLRSWYNMEVRSPNGLYQAELICRESLTGEPKLAPRYASEMYSKLGRVLELSSRGHVYTNRERAIALLKEAMQAYFEGAWVGRNVAALNKDMQLDWMQQTLGRLFTIIGNEVDHVFHLVEHWADTGHDVDLEAARVVLEPLRKAGLVSHSSSQRIAGLAKKAGGKLTRAKLTSRPAPGIAYAIDTLGEIAAGS